MSPASGGQSFEFDGQILVISGDGFAGAQLTEAVEHTFPGIRVFNETDADPRQGLRMGLRQRPSLILAVIEDGSPEAPVVLEVTERLRPGTPVVFVGDGRNTAEAIKLIRCGGVDYLTFAEVHPHELRRRLSALLPKRQPCSRASLERLLAITRAGNETRSLRALLEKSLAQLIELAGANRGLVLLGQNKQVLVGAFMGLDEEQAVAIASCHSALLEDAGGPRQVRGFELSPGNAIESPEAPLHNAGLRRGYLVPIGDKPEHPARGLVILATPESPTRPCPWLLEKAAEAISESVKVLEVITLSREERRAAAIRLGHRGQEIGELFKLARELSEPQDLAGLARALGQALNHLVMPDLIGIYLGNGRFSHQEVIEVHPIPLEDIKAFEAWFKRGLAQDFGGELAAPESEGSASEGGGALTPPKGFARYDWIRVPPAGPQRGVIAMAGVLDNSYGRSQKRLATELAGQAAAAIERLTHSFDEREILVQSLLDGLPVGVALLDAYGRIVLANPTGVELLRNAGKVSEDERLLELCGESFADVTVGIEQSQRSFSRERRVASNVFFVSVARVALPTTFTPTRAPAYDLLFEDDQSAPPPPTGYAIALRDVTKAYDIRQQLAQAEKLSTIGEMVSGVAHELNNPLTSIRGYAELLMEGDELPAQLRQDLTRIKTNARRCARIVEDLLSFARKRALSFEEIDMPPLLGEVFDLLVDDLRRGRIALRKNFEPTVQPIQGDPHLLRQIFVNLITNARQAIEEGGQEGLITISLSSQGDKTLVAIDDSGPGIRPDQLPRLFDPFFTTKDTKGTGLGLSICYGLVQDHGGHIRAESPPGQGARFIVEFPTSNSRTTEGPEPSAAPATIGENSDPHADHNSREPVLIVEPIPVVRRLIKDMVSQAGYTADVAASAEEALATLKFMSYAAIVVSHELAGDEPDSLRQTLIDNEDPHAQRLVLLKSRGDSNGSADTAATSRSVRQPFTQKKLQQTIAALIATDQC
jgi:signal transduction histidine kinase/DNA-binding response OmpR family regulator